MSKAILLSIKPKYIFDILKGRKTIEVRKNMPKCDLPIDVYIYCTKDKTELYTTDKGYVLTDFGVGSYYKKPQLLNGKVVAKFTLRKAGSIAGMKFVCNGEDFCLEGTCLTFNELHNYLNCKTGYAWHIEDLVIFDRPRELREFHTNIEKEPPEELLCPECGKPMKYYEYKYLTKAPQSYCFIESEAGIDE